jgi:hypothetical protein
VPITRKEVSLKRPNYRFKRKPSKSTTAAPRRGEAPKDVTLPFERKPPKQYGKAFVLLEDSNKNTFEFAAGAWIPYGLTISQCRKDCMVTELPQKVNGNTRYEVRLQLPVAT